jgi:hypothetical protein
MKIFLHGINVDVINQYCILRLCDDQCKLTKNFKEIEESSLKRDGLL